MQTKKNEVSGRDHGNACFVREYSLEGLCAPESVLNACPATGVPYPLTRLLY